MDAGVFIFGGGIGDDEKTTLVTVEGTVTDGPYPETKEQVGGFVVLDVPTRADAIEWAAKIAVACRCAQEVRVLLPDPRELEQALPDAAPSHGRAIQDG